MSLNLSYMSSLPKYYSTIAKGQEVYPLGVSLVLESYIWCMLVHSTPYVEHLFHIILLKDKRQSITNRPRVLRP